MRRNAQVLTAHGDGGTMVPMIIPQTLGYDDPALGAFKPFKALKKVGKGVLKVAKVAAMPVAFVSVAAFKLATKPIRSKLSTLKKRRALKLAWDRRRSTTPTPAENAEARTWAKASLRRKGPHGVILATLAGDDALFGDALGIAPAAIVAAAPVLLKVLDLAMKSFAKEGSAPADPTMERMAQDIERRVPGAEVEYIPGEEAMTGAADTSILYRGMLGITMAGLVFVAGVGVARALR